jgi:hypothetical protein
MQFKPYNRNPFEVEALLITEENLEEVAPLIGNMRKKGNSRYIAVNALLVPHIPRVYVGWWVTRQDNTLRCYSPRAFSEQFSPAEAVTETSEGVPEVSEPTTEDLILQANAEHAQYAQWEASTFPAPEIEDFRPKLGEE